MDMPIRPISAPEPELQNVLGAGPAPAAATGGRIEPTLESQAPAKKAEQAADLDIETIHSVIALARRVAKQNYEEHLEAARTAKTREEFEAAVNAATKAFEANNSMRTAQNYFDNAEGNIQHGGLLFMQGKQQEAEKRFTTAGAAIRTAADKIDEFSAYVMQSPFMEKAIAFVAKADEVKNVAADKVTGAYVNFEQSAARTAEGFARGLKSFSERMVEFGHKVAAAPAQIRDLARDKAVSLVEATASVMSGFLSRVKKSVIARTDAIDAKVADIDRRIDRKMEAIDARVTQGIDRVKEDAHHAWNTIEQHAQAAMKASRDLAERAKAEGQEMALNGHAAVRTVGSIGKGIRAVLASQFVANKNDLVAKQKRSQP